MILFLAANPRDTGRLALDREGRAIHLERKRSGYRDRFDFVTRWASEPLDLLRELRELKPTIVHFSGHGAQPAGTKAQEQRRDAITAAAPSSAEPGSVMFDSASGCGQVMTPAAFAQTLDAAGASVRLVVLNACYTASIAEALLAQVDCVVGMSGTIHDDTARNFAIGFYGGLGEYESIAAAFKQGRAAIHLDGLPETDWPPLQVRDGFDAAQIILAAIAPSGLVATPCRAGYKCTRPCQVDRERSPARRRPTASAAAGELLLAGAVTAASAATAATRRLTGPGARALVAASTVASCGTSNSNAVRYSG